jgi:phosphate transport system substrate-binding protein
MPTVWRFLRPALLVTLMVSLALPALGYAQEDTTPAPVVIQGTPELEKLVGAIRDAYQEQNADADVQLDPGVGQSRGFDALCAGDVDIVMSTEPIPDEKIAACEENGQSFIETALAYEAVALVATPGAGITCLDSATLDNAWQLGAPAEVTWTDLGSAALDTPVEFYGPEALSPTYMLFRTLVPAGDLRDGIVTTDDVANILDKVKEDGSSAMGFLSLADLDRLDPDNTVTPLQIQDAEANCITPSVSTLAARTYPLGRTDYLYVNAESAQREEVRSFLQFALTDEMGVKAIGTEQGYTLADDATYEFGVNNILNNKTGRTFSRPASPVIVSTAAEGTVTLVGASLLRDLTNPIQSQFTTRFLNATVEVNTLGNTAGWAAFCAGDADVLQTTRDATDDETALCDENSIDPYEIDLGYQALVLVAPAGNDWLECMDGDLAASLFRVGTDEQPAATKWSDLNSDWPETDLLLVVPPRRTGETDYLIFTLIGDLTFAFRQDALEDDDPLYRAQGVANTDNGLSYLWWTDFQDSAADVKLLAVDTGSGCIAPSAETFEDGTYPLSFPVRYYFSRASFDNALLRAFLWHFFDQTSLDTIAKYPFVGLDVELMGGDMRDSVFAMLDEVEQQIAATAAEEAVETEETGTPQPTAEASPTGSDTTPPAETATPEPTAEASPTESDTTPPAETATPQPGG